MFFHVQKVFDRCAQNRMVPFPCSTSDGQPVAVERKDKDSALAIGHIILF